MKININIIWLSQDIFMVMVIRRVISKTIVLLNVFKKLFLFLGFSG